MQKIWFPPNKLLLQLKHKQIIPATALHSAANISKENIRYIYISVE
jgi:hypothetical protein